MKRSIRVLLMVLATLVLVASIAGADPKPPGGGDSSQSVSGPQL